jgi:hypothetical protein
MEVKTTQKTRRASNKFPCQTNILASIHLERNDHINLFIDNVHESRNLDTLTLFLLFIIMILRNHIGMLNVKVAPFFR